jgi:hypothetical protein
MKRLVVLIVASLILCSCSRIKVGYSFTDDALKNFARDAIDLNDEQKDSIYKEIDLYMAWHRKTMLPVYADYLEVGATELRTNQLISTKEFSQRGRLLEEMIDDTIRPMIPPVARLLHSLDEKQIEQLDKMLADQVEELEKQYATDSKEQGENLRKTIVDFWDDWLVELNGDQERTVEEYAILLSAVSKPSFSFRRARQKDLIDRLNEKQSVEEIQDYLSVWILNPDQLRSIEVRKSVEEARELGSQMNFELFSSLVWRQKLELAKKFEGYAKDFRALSIQN